jgi:hypothetical protein
MLVAMHGAEKLLQKKGGVLRTHIQMNTKGNELFKRYTNSSDDTIDVTFNLKDFAVIVQFCKAVAADVMVRMGAAGTPLLAEAVWEDGAANNMSDNIQAELLLATISESVQAWLPISSSAVAMLPYALRRSGTSAGACLAAAAVALLRHEQLVHLFSDAAACFFHC